MNLDGSDRRALTADFDRSIDDREGGKLLFDYFSSIFNIWGY